MNPLYPQCMHRASLKLRWRCCYLKTKKSKLYIHACILIHFLDVLCFWKKKFKFLVVDRLTSTYISTDIWCTYWRYIEWFLVAQVCSSACYSYAPTNVVTYFGNHNTSITSWLIRAVVIALFLYGYLLLLLAFLIEHQIIFRTWECGSNHGFHIRFLVKLCTYMFWYETWYLLS